MDSTPDAHWSRRRFGTRLLTGVVSIAVAVLIVYEVSRVFGMSWSAVFASLGGVGVADLVVLVSVWTAGLVMHAAMLTGALPGLTLRRALLLNLSGSAVSNLMPFGGPAGMAVGYAMSRRWGVSSDRFASFTLISNLWNAAAKLVVGTALLGAVAVTGSAIPPGTRSAVLAACGWLAAVAAGGVLVLRTETAAQRTATMVTRVLYRNVASRDRAALWLMATRREVLSTMATNWRKMSVTVLVYMGLQALLLQLCLRTVDGTVPLTAVAAAFAVDRLVSLVPVTPASTGVAEISAVAILTALGMAAPAAVAGVLLYRLILVALEVPVGGLLGATWWLRVGRAPAGGVA